MHHVIGSLYGMVATKGINVESGSWEKETPKAGQKSKDSYHSLNFTHRPFLDEEMDTLQLVSWDSWILSGLIIMAEIESYVFSGWNFF